MKKILLITLLIPALANSQCLDWMGKSSTSISEIEPVIKKYLDFNLNKPYKADKGYAYYSGSSKSSMVRFSFMKKTGSEKKVINSIYISGPSAKIDRLISEYFAPALSPCIKEKNANMFSWDNMILVYDFEGSKQNASIKTIEIRRQ